MWGMIAAAVIYVAAIGIIIGREGMRHSRTHTEWTMEEIEKVKGSAVMGWKDVDRDAFCLQGRH